MRHVAFLKIPSQAEFRNPSGPEDPSKEPWACHSRLNAFRVSLPDSIPHVRGAFTDSSDPAVISRDPLKFGDFVWTC